MQGFAELVGRKAYLKAADGRAAIADCQKPWSAQIHPKQLHKHIYGHYSGTAYIALSEQRSHRHVILIKAVQADYSNKIHTHAHTHTYIHVATAENREQVDVCEITWQRR